MTERRLVQSIHTREVIPTSLASDDSCYLIALTGDQIEILSNLMNYAHRRINWCDEVADAAHYYLPDDSAWNELQALVDDLEYRLMDTCSLQELIDAIEGLCDCLPTATRQLPGPLSSGALEDGLGDGSIVYPEPETEIESDENACASAQTLWYMLFEYITEVAIPVSDWSFELIVPLMLGYFASIGVVVKVLFQLGLTIEFLQESLSIFVTNSGESTLNFLTASKQELVCAFYNYFKSGSATDWAEVDSIIEAGDAPSGVKPWLKLGFRLLRATAQIFNATAWAVLRIEPGYCDECGQPSGCFDFCDPDWTIDPNYATLDPEACTITMQGELGNPVGAYRTIADIALAKVTVDLDPPNYAPPDFYALVVRLWDSESNFESQTIEVSDNGRQEVELLFTLEDPTLLEVRSVAGTHTVVYDVCVRET